MNNKTPVLLGFVLGILSLANLVFLSTIYPYFSWNKVLISHSVALITFTFFLNKVRVYNISVVAIGFGFTYIIIGWIGIKIFPPTKARDAWDLIVPFYNILRSGIVNSLALYFLGKFVNLFIKSQRNNN